MLIALFIRLAESSGSTVFPELSLGSYSVYLLLNVILVTSAKHQVLPSYTIN